MEAMELEPEEQDRLLARKAELEALLARVNRSLSAAGYKLPSAPHAASAKSGLNIGGALSFRGVEKAGELFDYLDEDGDGFLSFADMRAFHSAVYETIPTDLSMTSREAWQAYMHECGVELRDGRLDREQFVQYKVFCEKHRNQSLEHELQTLGLPLLPHKLQQWRALHAAWLEYEGFVKGDLKGFLLDDGHISLEEVPIILRSVGLFWPKSHLFAEMLLAYRKRNVNDEIQLKAYHRHMFGNPERFKGQILEEYEAFKDGKQISRNVGEGLPKMLSVPKAALLAWFFANRPAFEPSSLSARSLRTKLGVAVGIRKLRRAIVLAEAVEENLRRRSTFSGLEPAEVEAAMFVSSFTVGEMAEGFEHMSARLKLNHISNVRQGIATLKLPSDTGTAIMIDLLLRVHATEEAIDKAVRSLRALLSNQLAHELQHFRTFKTLQVYHAVNDTSDAPVIRIAVIFRRESSIDSLFARNRLKWSLADLVNSFSIEASCSLHLSDMLENPSLVLQNALGAKVTTSVSVERNLTLKALERLSRAMKWAPAKKIVDNEMVSKREADTNIFASRKHISNSYDDSEVHEFTTAYAPLIKHWADKALSWLRSWRDGAWNFHVTVAEAVELMTQFSPALKRRLNNETTLPEGFLQKWFNPFYRRLRKEMQQLAASLQEFQEAEEQRKRLRHQKMLLSAEVDEGQDKVDQEQRRVIEQLRRLNIKVEDHDALWGGRSDKTPEDAVEGAYASQMMDNKLALEAFDACHQACIGVDTIALFMGKAQLTLSFEGFDVFDVLPRPSNNRKRNESGAIDGHRSSADSPKPA